MRPLLLLPALISVAGIAFQPVAAELAPDHLTIGIGLIDGSDYEGSNSYVLTPAAAAVGRWRGHAISWHGNSLSVDLVPEHKDQQFKLNFGPFVNLNFDRATTSKDAVVALIRKRKVAVEAGAFAGFTAQGVLTSKYDTLSFRLSGSHDIGNVHKSYIITPTVEYLMPISKATALGFSASMDVVGRRYGNYYFGVGDASSARSGLPVYRPGEGTKSTTFGLYGATSLRGDLNKRGFAVGAMVNYERLLGQFAASPLVATRGDKNQWIGTVGAAYIF